VNKLDSPILAVYPVFVYYPHLLDFSKLTATTNEVIYRIKFVSLCIMQRPHHNIIKLFVSSAMTTPRTQIV